MYTQLALLSLSTLITAAQQSRESIPGPAAYTATAGFPTSAFSSYYIPPLATQEPQPALYDPVLNITFPLNLTNPNTIPTTDDDPVYYPKPVANLSDAAITAIVQSAVADIVAIIGDGGISGNCSKCLAALSVAKLAAQVAPSKLPGAMVSLCQKYKFASNASCVDDYAAGSFGAIWTQVLAFADVSGLDGRYICNRLSKTFCPMPTTLPLNMTGLFPKPKPANATSPKASGERVKVLHLSDFHIDPRYSVASEANCSGSFCCRANIASKLPAGQLSLPAPLYGSFKCDTPYYLALAVLQAIAPLTGTQKDKSHIAWTIYTGDLVSHDSQNQLSRAYTEYAETSVFGLFKEYIGGPVFAALGNHDSNPEAIDSPHSLPGPLGTQQSWNYDHVAGLWQHDGWINSTTADQAKTHYGAYSVQNQYGLRIITLNTDFWYRSNYLNYINTTDPDPSGMLHFLIQELQAAEDAKERVWIVGHVLTGWDGSNPLDNPTDLFYQIVDRYSPHVIANIFFGHTHEDEVMIYYSNNGTARTSANAQTPGWIGPSVTPLTNLNSGFRMYEVDTGSFEIYEAYTWYSDVNSFPKLNGTAKGPVYEFEYSTRDAYNISWPTSSPLDAKYWHAVTEAMSKDLALVEKFNRFQGKMSVKTPNCTSQACAEAKICYMRSGSGPLGKECPQGYGSVQSPFKPTS